MSTEVKLLRAIVQREPAAIDLSQLRAQSGISAGAFRELISKLYKKGYLTEECRSTPAGRRVASRALGQVLLRRQSRNSDSMRTTARKVFRGSQAAMPPPFTAAALEALRAAANERIDAKVAHFEGRSPPEIPTRSDRRMMRVRESELEELKPR